MVSTSHKNAEYYFDRDVRGVVDFFKRKFDFESIERVPKFSDVKREYNMDEDLKASGYSKLIEEAIEEELRPMDETSEGSDAEGSTDEENESEGDKNEEIVEKAPVIDNSRLGKWLSTDDKPAAEAEEPEPVEEFVELTKEEMEERKQKAEEIIKRNQMTQEELDEVEDRVGELEVRDPADAPAWDNQSMSQMSKLSTTSCSPEEIKHRVKKQIAQQKKRERARLLKKGESAKYTAVRRELKNEIKDDFFY